MRIEIPDTHRESAATLRLVATLLNHIAEGDYEKRAIETGTTSFDTIPHPSDAINSLPPIPIEGVKTDTEIPKPFFDFSLPKKSQLPPPSEDRFDSAGVQWDPKIHSRTQSQDEQGQWKIKRSSLKPKKNKKSKMKTEVNAVPIPPPPPSVPMPPITQPDADFAILMRTITDSVNTKKLTYDKINAMLKPLNISSLLDLHKKPELIPAVHKLIQREVNKHA